MVQDATIITSTLIIYSTPAIVLFDAGSTHTLIAKTFVDRIDVLVDDLGYDLVVSIPTIAMHTSRECVKGIIVVIQPFILLTNFTVLPMQEFDLIFDMDWMTHH